MMLGLPSTTEVGRRLPKEAFYEHLALDKRTREEFVRLIDRIEIANSVKPATANLADGSHVHEIIVLRIDLKCGEVPEHALEAIAKSNPHKLVFRLEPIGATCVFRDGMWRSDDMDGLKLEGPTMDEAWDSAVSQVAFGDSDGKDIDERLAREKLRCSLESEIASLDAKCRKTKQINKRNELFAQLKARMRELDQLYDAKGGK